MPVSNVLKQIVLEAVRQKAALLEKTRARIDAVEAEKVVELDLRKCYLRVQEEARRGYTNNGYPPQRLILVNGKGYWLDLAGSVQGDVVRELEIES